MKRSTIDKWETKSVLPVSFASLVSPTDEEKQKGFTVKPREFSNGTFLGEGRGGKKASSHL